MDREKNFILPFDQITAADVSLVGGKNASLGEMISHLGELDIAVPGGFALTAFAYRYFLNSTGLAEKIKKIISDLDVKEIKDLQKKGRQIRRLIVTAELPPALVTAVEDAYRKLELKYGRNVSVAVRSSATAEDLPTASFAGQQETYLNVIGVSAVLRAIKFCFSSLFNDRAISYRADKGFSHFDVALSVGVQKMVRSDLASSGVAFSLDTETGFDKVVLINSSWGLGETVVQGKATPDEFIVFKPALAAGKDALIAKNLGAKERKLVYSQNGGTKEVLISEKERHTWSLSKEEVLKLAAWVVRLEDYFSKKYGRYQPMDIEWAKDGESGNLFIVQARPETVHSVRKKDVYWEYVLREKGKILTTGVAIGSKIAGGAARIIKEVKNIDQFQAGEILVTSMTDPDWEPIMKIAAGIVTERGGRTSHAAIVSRELGIPCVVGTGNATRVLRDHELITLDCSGGQIGFVCEGRLAFEIREHKLSRLPRTQTKIMVNIGTPEEAFSRHYLPVAGVGLGRLEFIITSHIKIHPNALIDFDRLTKESLTDKAKRSVVAKISALTKGYSDKKEYYVDELAEGIAKIAAAFYPHEVIIRFSDFKTNEYRALIGGEFYEPVEANPMIGWRGASRYYDNKFKQAFGLECQAIKRVREVMGFENVSVLVPFCRTPEEGKKVIAVMSEMGLDREKDNLKVYVMCEIPANVILAESFLDIFDGMSIGSNDLTQLVLGLDRDSDLVAGVGNEKNEAVKYLIKEVIKRAKEKGKYIGICGQAPSDFPDFAKFLVREGIDSISLAPDSVIKTLELVAEEESRKQDK
jgi:pyruvate,water dikinase